MARFISLAAPFVIPIALAAGCGRTPPPPEHDPGEFARFHAEELVARERARMEGLDSTGLALLIDSLRVSFGIDPGRHRELLAYYRDSLPRWEAFLGVVLERLEERERLDAAERTSRDSAGGSGSVEPPR